MTKALIMILQSGLLSVRTPNAEVLLFDDFETNPLYTQNFAFDKPWGGENICPGYKIGLQAAGVTSYKSFTGNRSFGSGTVIPVTGSIPHRLSSARRIR